MHITSDFLTDLGLYAFHLRVAILALRRGDDAMAAIAIEEADYWQPK